MCVCVCVCVLGGCVSVCVCTCVCDRACLYPSTVEVSFVCNDVLEIPERTDQRSCIVGIMLYTSSKFLHLSF